MTIYSHIFPDKSSKTKSESAAHSSRTLLRGGYQIPAVLKKSRGKANPFPPAKIALLCLVRISPRQIKKARSVFSFGVFLWRNSKCLGGTWDLAKTGARARAFGAGEVNSDANQIWWA